MLGASRLLFIACLSLANAAAVAAAELAVEVKADCLVITDGNMPVATYVFRDEVILRPYFSHVHGPGGTPLTRNHPPIDGKDPTDHATMHPGIWLAFGDISGQDFWRNKARMHHERFIDRPAVTAEEVSFAVASSLLTASGNGIAVQTDRYRLSRRPSAYLLVIDATIASKALALHFGDQEEMGLGVRVATPLTVKNGGAITNSDGGKNEKGTWGKAADWCDYSAKAGDRRAGITIMAHPDNFAPSRFHSRDYGLLVANPFAIEAFGAGPKARTPVTREQPLRLRFAVLLHDAPVDTPIDIGAEFKAFVQDTR